MIFALAAPAGATGASPLSPRSGPGVAEPTSPRDVVLGSPTGVAARISASAPANRYPINDGSGATIAVAVTAACRATCTAADPQAIANFVGTLVHGPEVELLTVQLDTPSEIAFDCGYGAQACYYVAQSKIVVSGNDTPANDGASRDFVLAHEYGHHVARHRRSPAPFPAAIDWGTPRWSSHENVCRLTRAGKLSPGSFGLRYFRDPGEAFAEAFAHNRFPESGVPWRWLEALRPDAAAFRAIREDTLDPWLGSTGLTLGGRLPGRGGGPGVKSFRTPLDGLVTLRPATRRRPPYSLSLLNRAGRVLRASQGAGRPGRRLSFTVCGQSHLRVAVKSTRSGGAFKLQVRRP